MRPSPLAILAVLGVLAAGVAYGVGRLSGGGSGSRTATALVTRVVDGDTIAASVGGADERVRYIGVDTPESVKPNTPVQCFARAASALNHRLVAGLRVRLVYDAERRDRYGRLLAYVFRVRDGAFVNAELVRRGYARTLTIPPNVRYARRFARLARAARTARRGLWRAC